MFRQKLNELFIIWVGEIQLELILSDRSVVVAHLNREKFARLDLKTDQKVYLEPRQVKCFEQDERKFKQFTH